MRKIVIVLFIVFLYYNVKAQDSNVLDSPIFKHQENLKGDSILEEKWDDKLIRMYKYSDEEFDKLGYDYIKTYPGDNQRTWKIYRNCEKGIIATVIVWSGVKISVSLIYYPPDTRKTQPRLRYCELNK